MGKEVQHTVISANREVTDHSHHHSKLGGMLVQKEEKNKKQKCTHHLPFLISAFSISLDQC